MSEDEFLKKIDIAFDDAIDQAMDHHYQLGESTAVAECKAVIILSPEEILKRLQTIHDNKK